MAAGCFRSTSRGCMTTTARRWRSPGSPGAKAAPRCGARRRAGRLADRPPQPHPSQHASRSSAPTRPACIAGFVERLFESHPGRGDRRRRRARRRRRWSRRRRARHTPLFTSPLPAPRVIEKLARYLAKALAETHRAPRRVHGRARPRRADHRRIGRRQERARRSSSSAAATAWSPTTWSRSRASRPSTLEGRCPPMLKDFLEVRGLGLLNIRTIFGETAVRRKMKLRLVAHLERPQPGGRDPTERLPLARAHRGDPRRHRPQGHHPGRRRPQPRGAGGGGGAQRDPQAARHRLHGRVPRPPEQRAAECDEDDELDPRCSSFSSAASRAPARASRCTCWRTRGYYCVDNLPANAAPRGRRTSSPRPATSSAAVSIDARSAALAALPEHIDAAEGAAASTAACSTSRRARRRLLRRFSETRRRAPARRRRPDAAPRRSSASARCSPASRRSASRIDTSDLQPRVLQNWIRDLLGIGAGALTLLFESFAYKRRHAARRRLGVRLPHAAQPALRPAAAPLHRARRAGDRVPRAATPRSQRWLEDVAALLARWLPEIVRENRSSRHGGDRLHRRPPPLGVSRRASSPKRFRERLARAGAPPRPRARRPRSIDELAALPAATPCSFPAAGCRCASSSSATWRWRRPACSDGAPFGVCPSARASEVGAPAMPVDVGTLAKHRRMGHAAARRPAGHRAAASSAFASSSAACSQTACTRARVRDAAQRKIDGTGAREAARRA